RLPGAAWNDSRQHRGDRRRSRQIPVPAPTISGAICVSSLGLTFGLYVARVTVMALFAVFAGTLVLIFVIDFVELLRQASDVPDISVIPLMIVSLERTPSVAERALPFAVLFGAMAAFLQLSRKLELVVARASGISAWQFL